MKHRDECLGASVAFFVIFGFLLIITVLEVRILRERVHYLEELLDVGGEYEETVVPIRA